MFYRIIRGDILKSKLITLITVLFVAAAAMLVSIAAMGSVHLVGALDSLMKQAKTPHFMQMHAGELELEPLTEFAAQHRDVEAFQVVEFLNIDGAYIVLGDDSLANSVQDNGFSVQSHAFDFLLDLEGNIAEPASGELYVPLAYRHLTNVGDRAYVAGKEFTVAGFVRDSQMNASLAGSKRFLVSANDFAQLQSLGQIEYLIEFRLHDASAVGAFETEYANSGLAANGPALTYPLFKLINALSDGLMIAVILLISALVIAIALMCIRFTLLAKMEEDYREIGVMKAIGLRTSDVKKIYLVKYVAIAAVGGVLGFVLSLLLKDVVLENIRLYLGEAENGWLASLLSMIGIVLVFLLIVAYVNRVLKRFRKISAVEAIRFGVSQESTKVSRRLSLHKNRLLSTNIFLGMKDVLTRKRLYMTMLIVLVLAVFVMTVPHNLYTTLSSKSFIQYMGIGDYDIRIQQTNDGAEQIAERWQQLASDDEIAKFAVMTTKTFKVKKEDGTEENIKIELGDHSLFPIAYTEGKAPAHEDEIALSILNADELEKKVGDKLAIVVQEQTKTLTVSGIYSDITNGGKTAKAMFTDDTAPTVWNIGYIVLADSSQVDRKIFEYEEQFEQARVSDVDEFVQQTFGSTIDSVEMASYVAAIIAIVITVLVTLLFMKLLIAKDSYSIAVLSALGFTRSDVKKQYIARSVFVLVIGVLVGMLLANTLGEMLAGGLIASFGAAAFEFEVDPLFAYLLHPLLMMGAVLIATWIGVSGKSQLKISERLKESSA